MIMSMNFSVIVTIGPAVKEAAHLRAIDNSGPCIYRINGAHYSTKSEVLSIAEHVRSILPNAPLLLDLPGNKIRLTNLPHPLTFKRGQVIKILASQLNFKPFFNYQKIFNGL